MFNINKLRLSCLKLIHELNTIIIISVIVLVLLYIYSACFPLYFFLLLLIISDGVICYRVAN